MACLIIHEDGQKIKKFPAGSVHPGKICLSQLLVLQEILVKYKHLPIWNHYENVWKFCFVHLVEVQNHLESRHQFIQPRAADLQLTLNLNQMIQRRKAMTVLVDASSAIILYKANLHLIVCEMYNVVMSTSVCVEITGNFNSGAEAYQQLLAEKKSLYKHLL